MNWTEQQYADYLAQRKEREQTMIDIVSRTVREGEAERLLRVLEAANPAPDQAPDRDEAAEQVAVVQWCRQNEARWPELRWIFAIPNGGYRPGKVGAVLSGQGVRKGAPDLMLPVARGGYHGLFIELKRVKGGWVSKEQAEFLAALTAQDYRAVVCRGAIPAIKEIEKYMEGKNDE